MTLVFVDTDDILRHYVCMLTPVLAICSAMLFAQATEPTFEVISLKPSAPGSIARIGPAPGGQRYSAAGVTLKTMIQTAYHVRADQVAGGPDWIDRDRFDLEAKAAQPATAEQLRGMLRSLLAERFQLQFGSTTKDLPVYVLTVDKGGPKLTPHEAASSGDSRVDLKTAEPLHLSVTGTSASMDLFAYRMGYLLDRPMIDRTGLAGSYDFTLTYTMEPPDSMRPGMSGHDGRPIDFSGPTIFAALPKQMGLRLESAKAPVETMLIERAERPREN